MRIAILSDIHCNAFALRNVLDFMKDQRIDHYILLGDCFGYFPWAAETWELIASLQSNLTAIIGNHDELIIREKDPDPLPDYWSPIESNRKDLPEEAIDWLKGLKSDLRITLDNTRFRLVHGTPDNSLYGRFYPDNEMMYDWFPKEDEVLLLGHTHYPLLRKIDHALIINPGSVGQPRDGIQMASCCIFETNSREASFHRLTFDVEHCITLLENLNWYPHAIKTLKKKKVE